jgi:hypothetical protein
VSGRGGVRADVDEDLAADTGDKVGACVEVVERAVFAEGVADGEGHGAERVEAGEEEGFVAAGMVRDVMGMDEATY